MLERRRDQRYFDQIGAMRVLTAEHETRLALLESLQEHE